MGGVHPPSGLIHIGVYPSNMGLFPWSKKKRRADEAPEEWWERVSRLEADMRSLRLDMDQWYDKVRRGLQLIGKRQKALDESDRGSNGHVADEPASDLSEKAAILRNYRAGRR